MQEFRLTFGQKYRRRPHPIFGESLTPDHWVVVKAPDYERAYEAIEALLNGEWSNLEPAEEFDESFYPKGEYASKIIVETKKHEGECLTHEQISERN